MLCPSKTRFLKLTNGPFKWAMYCMYKLQDAGVGRKGPVLLDSLSKEELTAKCKQLLQLAQKAKQAKDGMWMYFFWCWVLLFLIGNLLLPLGLWEVVIWGKEIFNWGESENIQQFVQKDKPATDKKTSNFLWCFGYFSKNIFSVVIFQRTFSICKVRLKRKDANVLWWLGNVLDMRLGYAGGGAA